MEKIASKEKEHHMFEVELANLLRATAKVEHPEVLARVIPDHICRRNSTFIHNPYFGNYGKLLKIMKARVHRFCK